MIEFQEIRSLMTGRAGVFGILANMMKTKPDLNAVENLCKSMDFFFESLEFKGKKDEIVEAYEKLSGWYSVALSIDNNAFIEGKLGHEFGLLFTSDGEEIVSRVFPNTEHVGIFYKKHNYKVVDNGKEIGEMLGFMSELSQRCATFGNREMVKESVAEQRDFVNCFISPFISDFCQMVYNNAPNYGIYQFISIILHGFIMLDCALLDTLDKNL